MPIKCTYYVTGCCEVTEHHLRAAIRGGKDGSLPTAVRFTARWRLVVTHCNVNTRASGGWEPEVHSKGFYVLRTL
jgi:hypothetical protein